MVHKAHGLDTTAGQKVYSISGDTHFILSFAVEAGTDDFEKYILDNAPVAKITNNKAENPTIMSSDKDTFKEECETKKMAWDKNKDRCPSKLFDFDP